MLFFFGKNAETINMENYSKYFSVVHINIMNYITITTLGARPGGTADDHKNFFFLKI